MVVVVLPRWVPQSYLGKGIPFHLFQLLSLAFNTWTIKIGSSIFLYTVVKIIEILLSNAQYTKNTKMVQTNVKIIAMPKLNFLQILGNHVLL